MENVQLTLGGLIKHCRNLIWKGPYSAGRLSRGEYIISYLIVSLLGSAVGTVLWQIGGSLGSEISGVIGLALGVLGIKLIIKRSHDLGKNGWYYFIPLFSMIAVVAVAIVYAITNGLFSIGEMNGGLNLGGTSPIILVAFGLALVASGIRLLAVIVMILFKPGDKDTNKYGPDPLIGQPTSHSMYFIIGISAFALSIIIGSLGKPQVNLLDLQGPDMQGSDSDVVSRSNESLAAPEDNIDTNTEIPSDNGSSDLLAPLEDTP